MTKHLLLLLLVSSSGFALCKNPNSPFRPGDTSSAATLFRAIQACASGGDCECSTDRERACVQKAAQKAVDDASNDNLALVGGVVPWGTGVGIAVAEGLGTGAVPLGTASGTILYEVSLANGYTYLTTQVTGAVTALGATVALVGAVTGTWIGLEILDLQSQDAMAQFMAQPVFQVCGDCDLAAPGFQHCQVATPFE